MGKREGTHDRPADIVVGKHADESVYVPDVIIVRIDAAYPAGAAHLAFDVYCRPVREPGQRGSGVASNSEGHGNDNPCFVQVWVVVSPMGLQIQV